MSGATGGGMFGGNCPSGGESRGLSGVELSGELSEETFKWMSGFQCRITSLYV